MLTFVVSIRNPRKGMTIIILIYPPTIEKECSIFVDKKRNMQGRIQEFLKGGVRVLEKAGILKLKCYKKIFVKRRKRGVLYNNRPRVCPRTVRLWRHIIRDIEMANLLINPINLGQLHWWVSSQSDPRLCDWPYKSSCVTYGKEKGIVSRWSVSS